MLQSLLAYSLSVLFITSLAYAGGDVAITCNQSSKDNARGRISRLELGKDGSVKLMLEDYTGTATLSNGIHSSVGKEQYRTLLSAMTHQQVVDLACSTENEVETIAVQLDK